MRILIDTNIFIYRENSHIIPSNLQSLLKTFFDYFSGIKEGFAIELKYLKLFKVPIDPKVVFPDFIPPQSFYYFDDTLTKVK